MKKVGKMTLEKLATLMVEGFDEVRKEFRKELRSEVKSAVGELRGQMVTGFEAVRGDISVLQTDMTAAKRDVAEIKGEVGAHGKAIDSDAKTIINHETRIKKLEHVR